MEVTRFIMSGGLDPDKQRQRFEQYRVSTDTRLERQTQQIKHLEERILFLSGQSTVDPRLVLLERENVSKKLQLGALKKKFDAEYDKYTEGLEYKYMAMAKIRRLEETLAKIEAVHGSVQPHECLVDGFRLGKGTIGGALMDVARLIKEHAAIEESRDDAGISPWGGGAGRSSAASAGASASASQNTTMLKQSLLGAVFGDRKAPASVPTPAVVPEQEVMPAATGVAPDVSVPEWWRALVDIAGPGEQCAR